jgi:F-type H+-transporting ATPase subunit alpha
MKKVAGRLKIELSQYRDLEAFAQFGSDLDPDTQRTLARGERLVKALNQNERSPLPVAVQVVQVYAGTNGYLDRIDADRVEEFQEQLVDRVRSGAEDAMKKIADGDWGDEVQKELDKVIKQFAEDFGYDLDEEGQPLSDEDEDAATSRGRDKKDDDSDDDDSDSGSDEERDEDKEGAAA